MLSRSLSATTVYLVLVAVSSFASVLVFTANIVFQVDDAGLNPLQLVLAGTVWEATYFLFEVPTGVVADMYGRRRSVLLGLLISAAGLALVGAWPTFETILAGYVVLGIGGTFISGAEDAWVADEVGAERAGDVFLRGSQYARMGALLAIPLAAGLGSLDIQAPQFTGAALTLLLAGFALVAMRETGFVHAHGGDRPHLLGAFDTLAESRGLVRRRPVLLTVLAVAAVYGAASEGFDRLFTPHFLRDIGLPESPPFEPIVWFSLISAVQTLITIAVVERVRRGLDTTDADALVRALQAADLLRTAGVMAFAFASSFAVGLAAYLPTRVFVSLHYPLYQAWLNLRLEPRVRATMLSLAAQCDSLGQVIGGPGIGLVANMISTRAGLLGAGLMLLPVVPLYRRSLRAAAGEEPKETPAR